MGNDFQKVKIEKLSTMGAHMVAILGDGHTNPYGIPADLRDKLVACEANLNEAINESAEAKAADRAATQRKATEKLAIAKTLSTIAAMVYANPNVSTEMIVNLGLEARRRRTSAKPFTPKIVRVIPAVNGSVVLQWDRGGSGRSVMFTVEARSPDEGWKMVKVCTCTRVVLHGYAPGKETWFRVIAMTSKLVSVPSFPVGIYSGTSALPLESTG